ncbi:hypothetical protein ACI6PS_15300 [Flavobacterium sp. PLA-1-15]|uniref:hypothetical protein n=1 Tax=Flavobacterium sp. PLA-1-15 TaxID=3380533 RepID=UPI003B80A5F5
MMFLNNYIIAILLLSLYSFTQDENPKGSDIDILLNKSELAYKNFDDAKCLQYAKDASNLALKTSDSKRQYKSFFLMARVLSTLHMQKESTLYVKKMEALGYAKKDKILLAELKEIKAFNYRALGLDSQALIENNSIIELLKNVSTTNGLMIQARAYTNIGAYYFDIGKIDSCFRYQEKEKKILEKIPEELAVFKLSELLDARGYTFMEIKKLDSALYYFNKGFALKKKYKDPLLYIQYCAFADFYLAKGEKHKALEYYLKTIKNMKEHNVVHPNYLIVYKSISELYGELKQYDKETSYLKKYTHITDSVNSKKDKNVDYVMNVLLKENEQKHNSNNTKLNWVAIIIISFTILIIYIFYKKYRIAQRKTLLSAKIIVEKEHEANYLKTKINDSFEELITLAKLNHPSFYTRFQEVYPEFQKKLLSISPDLQLAELTLSAYIYLGFQAKEIADCTFKSFRTIQNRKNRLRKKLKLESSENLNIWIKNLVIDSDSFEKQN